MVYLFLKIQNLHWVEMACQPFIIPSVGGCANSAFLSSTWVKTECMSQSTVSETDVR